VNIQKKEVVFHIMNTNKYFQKTIIIIDVCNKLTLNIIPYFTEKKKAQFTILNFNVNIVINNLK